MRHNWASEEVHPGSGLQSFIEGVKGKEILACEVFTVNTKRPDREKGIHRLTDAMRKRSNRDGVACGRVVTDANEACKPLIT
jgi:hypothetical protein